MRPSNPNYGDGFDSSLKMESSRSSPGAGVGRGLRESGETGSVDQNASSPSLGTRDSRSSSQAPQGEYDNSNDSVSSLHDMSLAPAQSPQSNAVQRFPIEQSVPYLRIINRPQSPESRKLGDTAFKYHGLDHQGEEFRLLRILPNKSSIECRLFHAWLNSPPDYVAISYAWGDLGDTRSITLDGYDFPVTVSLWQILERLRSNQTAVTVWADAICIDQANIDERNHQVERMAMIYKMAVSVAAWLGPEYGHSQFGIDLLIELANADGNDPSYCERILKSPERTDSIKALGAVFDRHYWYRLWTVQELFNARQVDVYCGSSQISLTAFHTASKILTANTHVLRSLQLHGRVTAQSEDAVLSVLLSPLFELIPRREVNLLEAIRLTRRRFCEDPRDKIYGILGLVTAEERSHITPNYSLTKRQVFTNAVQHIIATTKRLDVLCRPMLPPQGAEYKPRHVAGALPTWLPDFSIPERGRYIRTWNSHFDASRGTDAVVALSGRQQKLQVLAVHIDSIALMSSSLRPWHMMIDVILVFLNWCSIIMVTYGFQKAKIQQFCRLLRRGVTREVDKDSINDRQWMGMLFGAVKRHLEDSVMSNAIAMDEQLSALGCSEEDMQGFDDQTVLYLLRRVMTGRRFCMTQSGIFLIVGGDVQTNHRIYVLLGASIPIILRPEGDEYSYIGDAYVDGYMYGRAIDELNSGTRKLESIVLI